MSDTGQHFMQTESLDSTTLNTNGKQQNKAFSFENKYFKKKVKRSTSF